MESRAGTVKWWKEKINCLHNVSVPSVRIFINATRPFVLAVMDSIKVF